MALHKKQRRIGATRLPRHVEDSLYLLLDSEQYKYNYRKDASLAEEDALLSQNQDRLLNV